MGSPAVRVAFLIAFAAVAWGSRRRTRRRVASLAQWAGSHRYRQAGLPRNATTPILRQRPQVLGSYEVPLGAGTGTLCDFTMSVTHGDVEVTAVVASLGGTLARFGVYDRKQLGHQGPLHSWEGPAELDTRSLHELKVESAAFEDRYQLLADEHAGDVAVENLFTPALLQWWTDQGDAGPSLEYESGTMVVVRERCSDRAPELDRLLAQATELGRAILAAGTAQPADPI